jgi:hypothetical protein
LENFGDIGTFGDMGTEIQKFFDKYKRVDVKNGRHIITLGGSGLFSKTPVD